MTPLPIELPIRPLTAETFASFGDVIEADQATMRLINGGTTERFHRLSVAEAEGEGVIISLFRGQPRRFPYEITMMERHPFGSQSVSEDAGGRPGEHQVFLASGSQGINYRRNVWHHPLMVLDTVSDFLVVDRDRPETNLEEFVFDTPYVISEPRP